MSRHTSLCLRWAAALVVPALLAGCAAKLTFVDRANGTLHTGATGGTSGGAGDASATIDGVSYAGPWVYQAAGGSFTLANVNTSSSASGMVTSGANSAFLRGMGTTTGTASAFAMSAHGNGMMHLRAADGAFVRCVFTFNSMSNTGLGQCERNDGRQFDLMVKR